MIIIEVYVLSGMFEATYDYKLCELLCLGLCGYLQIFLSEMKFWI